MATGELAINWSNQDKNNTVWGEYKLKLNSDNKITLPFFLTSGAGTGGLFISALHRYSCTANI